MTTRELILDELDHLGDDKLETVYSFLNGWPRKPLLFRRVQRMDGING
jgi:hypothetical protein